MYSVEITNAGGSQFKVISKDYEFVVDTKGGGVTPPDALLASLASCIGVYTRKYFEGAKLEAPEFKIYAEAEFTKESPVCFRQIRVRLELAGNPLDERRKKGLLEFAKNCPVHNTLHADPAVEITVG
ncbi:MAG TPA: OsmC family protein [Patescibacteria group bacterium]|nr:OsmC family protein [Patescibacteria group bacterium]